MSLDQKLIQNPVKHLNAFSNQTFLKKRSVLDVWQGSEYTSLDVGNLFKITVKPKTN